MSSRPPQGDEAPPAVSSAPRLEPRSAPLEGNLVAFFDREGDARALCVAALAEPMATRCVPTEVAADLAFVDRDHLVATGKNGEVMELDLGDRTWSARSAWQDRDIDWLVLQHRLVRRGNALYARACRAFTMPYAAECDEDAPCVPVVGAAAAARCGGVDPPPWPYAAPANVRYLGENQSLEDGAFGWRVECRRDAQAASVPTFIEHRYGSNEVWPTVVVAGVPGDGQHALLLVEQTVGIGGDQAVQDLGFLYLTKGCEAPELLGQVEQVSLARLLVDGPKDYWAHAGDDWVLRRGANRIRVLPSRPAFWPPH
jgi:hypothetical protein